MASTPSTATTTCGVPVIFPHNVGLGCTRDPALVTRVTRATAEEVAATGLDWTFSPCIAVARDIRWGRSYESFGETPELVSQMAAAAVAGYQPTILACAKHYLADGGTEGGQDQGDARIDEPTLRAIHLPGYRAAVGAGVGSVIVSFSSWHGQKMHGNRYLLTDVLKGELGFQGFVVSDWAGIHQLPGDFATQVETSINAGIDMAMEPGDHAEFIATLRAAVQSGRVPMSRIDDAVRRILRQKLALGLFDSPLADPSLAGSVGSDAHRQVGREAVRAVKHAGVPTVVVLISGRPLILEPILHEVGAIVAAWLPGTEGAGVADVLFGDYAPTGRLSQSWPRSMAQVPINLGDPGYDPLFPYGYGLTY